jgi:phosphate starvation-inducible PhoH-like protein
MAKRKTRKQKIQNNWQGNLENFHPKTAKQHKLLESIYNNPITIAKGSPGTGKTLVSLFAGLEFLKAKQVDRLVYVRSDIDSSEYKSQGALPGEYDEKFQQLIAPLVINLKKLLPPPEAEYWAKKIEGVFVQDLRGRDFERCFLIADEAQNFTPHSVKTLLTRINQDSKFVVIGDTNQRDAKFNDGLSDASYRLKGLAGVGIVNFLKEDIVRHSLISNILERYES